MAHIKKKHFYLLATLLFLLLILVLFVVFKQSSTPLTGALRTQSGIAKDGVYDIKLVGYNKQSGAQVVDQGFDNVPISDGQYAVPISVKRFADNGSVVIQSCYKADPDETNSPNDLNCANNQASDVIIDCARDYSLVGSSDLLSKVTGDKQLTSSGSCADSSSVEQLGLANSNLPETILQMGPQGISGTQGLKGEKGDQGEKGAQGEPGQDGVAGSNGGPGSRGPAGDPASDDQTLTFNGLSLLSISGGNTVDLSGLDTDTLSALACSVGQIVQFDGSAWVCASPSASSDSQTLSLVTNLLSISNGNSVNLASYLDNTDNQNLFLTINTDNGTDPVADTATDTLNLISGSGVTITGDGGTDSITVASTLGTSISNSEIDNATLTFAKLASNSCGTNDIIKFNGSAWVCATDNDSGAPSEASIEAFIFDGDNTGTLSSGTLALDSLSYTGTIDDANVNDALTISSAGSVADGALSANVTKLGSTIETGEITNSTILFEDLAQNSCGLNQVIKWNGSAWACANDTDTDTDTQDLSLSVNTLSLVDGGSVDLSSYLDNTDSQNLSYVVGTQTLSIGGGNSVSLASLLDNTDSQDLTLTGNTLALSGDGTSVDLSPYLDNTDNQSLFLTINTDNGTDPVADTATDTLNLISGSGVTITGDGGTDSITVASTLGTDISSSEIVNSTILSEDIFDGTIANADLANNSITVTAGSGLVTGGTVSLGGTVTLDIGAGNGISVNTNDISIDLTVATDSLSSTIASGSGLELLPSGVTLLQGCSDGQILKWGEASDEWGCSNDSSSGAGPDTLDYVDFEDTLNLDATTTTVLGASNLVANLDSTGDYLVQDNGTTVLSVLDNGTFQFRNSVDNASSFLVEEDGGLDIFEIDTVANAVRIGELVDDAVDVLFVLDGATADPTGIAGGMYYNTTNNKFRCYENGAWKDCIAELDTATFEDTTPAAFADNDTTEIFNDATKPNITVGSASSTVQISFNVDGISNTTADAFFSARVVFAVGANPSCASSTQVGRPKISTFTTNTTHPYSIEGTFIHTPGSAGDIRYTVCSSASAVGTITDTPSNVTISLVELGS